MILRTVVLTLMSACLSSAVWVLSNPPVNCTQQGLSCSVSFTNCMDSDWLKTNDYTPSAPEDLHLSITIRSDEANNLHPVLLATWKIKDDGSIRYLKASELHLLVVSTNRNQCVRYSFKGNLAMRNPEGEKWSFLANMLVLDPGQTYRVSVFNIPKPEVGHSFYDISADLTVPDCQNEDMQVTHFCIERGSLWQPNITLSAVIGVRGRLTVGFRTDMLCNDYIVTVTCNSVQYMARTNKENQTTLNTTFELNKWPMSCCHFNVDINPLFPKCGYDCTRHQRTLSICPKQTETSDYSLYTLVAPSAALLVLLLAVTMCIFCRKSGKRGVVPTPGGDENPKQQQYQKLKQIPKVLVIYSQDHRLYRDVVLKLCAFLQAKCGAKVLVDLLDTTSVGVVGRLRWLEWQQRQLTNPSDKVLVLCSRGVQAKWRAMCDHGRVTLREDLLSPMDDMFTPFLNLFLPDMHQVGKLGKYMVAYFNDISSEEDVPLLFDIAVKYKLMKHFEELYFRILDMEKYEPGQVNHIQGIGGEEYFKCPSGSALKKAIQTFQSFQSENPDWFERECLSGEEEVRGESRRLLEQLQIPPIHESIPLIQHGPPVRTQVVDISSNNCSVQVMNPEVNPQRHQVSEAFIEVAAAQGCKIQYMAGLDQRSTPSLCVVEPVVMETSPAQQNWIFMKADHVSHIPVEHEEEDSLLPESQLYVRGDLSGSACGSAPSSAPPQSSGTGSQCPPPSELCPGQASEMEEQEVLEYSRKGLSSGSDHGYSSRVSVQHNDPLLALARLQEELFENSFQ